MGVQVAFDPAAFRQAYPEFAYLTDEQLSQVYLVATLYVRNDGGGPVRDASVQTQLIYLMVAHLSKLFMPGADGGAPSQLVGQITSASIGPVSTGVNAFSGSSVTQQWLMQSRYGAAFMAATQPFRSFRYVPGRARRIFDPYPYPLRGGYLQ